MNRNAGRLFRGHVEGAVLARRVAQLPEPFTHDKLLPLMNEAGVDRAVIVPPSWPGDRNDYGLEAVKRYPHRFAVMGRIPLA